MKAFVFGAGASAGSQIPSAIPATQRSPLSDNLFDDTYKVFAEGASLSTSEIAQIKKDVAKSPGWFEKWLTDEWTNARTKRTPRTVRARQVFFGRIALYTWLIMQSVSMSYTDENAYSVLLDKLEKNDEEFGIIDFNYDTLLDQAFARRFGYSMNKISDYLDNDFIKPHGSINWLLPKRDSDPDVGTEWDSNDVNSRYKLAGENMFIGGSLSLEKAIFVSPGHNDMMTPINIMKSRFGSQYFYPLIFLPLLSKEYGFIDAFQETILTKAKELVSKADDIYLIGYKARDQIVQEMFGSLKENVGIHIVSRSSASSIATDIMAWKPMIAISNMHTEGFAEFVKNY